MFLNKGKSYQSTGEIKEKNTMSIRRRDANYTKFILNDDIITIREKISSIMELLSADDFIQPKFSFLRNLQLL